MKRILSLCCVLALYSTLFSQDVRVWNGAQEAKVWDYASPNWLNPAAILPLPTTFISGATAKFNDAAVEGAYSLKVSGEVTVDSVIVDAASDYSIAKTESTDFISGEGALLKKGTGILTLDVENRLKGGTIVQEGEIKMKAQSSPNVFGDKIYFDGGVIDLATSSSSSYPNVSVPVEIADGKTATIKVSRYSYWASPVKGSGDLEISAGGERTMLGTNKAGGVTVDWSEFTGNVIISKNELSGVSPGYYGLLIPSMKTFDYEDITTADSLFANKTITIKSGAGLTSCSGVRGYIIGELQAEDESCFIAGYGAGASQTPMVYWLIGASNTDVVTPVTIYDAGGKGYNNVKIIKIGTGAYTFTSTKSITTASQGVWVKEGAFYVNTPIEDGITSLGRSKVDVLTIDAGAIGGGNGRLTGNVLVNSNGTLEVGYNGQTGMLALNDTLGGNTIGSSLIVKENANLVFKLATVDDYDKMVVGKSISIDNGIIVLKPASSHSIKDGDKFTIMTSGTSITDYTPTFTIDASAFPGDITFTSEVLDNVLGGKDIVITAIGASKINENKIDNTSISVYPNPTVGELNVSSKVGKIISLAVKDLQGRLINQQVVGESTAKLQMDSYQQGVYLITVNTEAGTATHKVFINK